MRLPELLWDWQNLSISIGKSLRVPRANFPPLVPDLERRFYPVAGGEGKSTAISVHAKFFFVRLAYGKRGPRL